MLTKKDIVELFKFLKSVYPSFEVDQYKINTWAKLLHDQNPAVIMRNAERHALESKFAPSLADLREKQIEAYSTSVLDQIREWEKNATRK